MQLRYAHHSYRLKYYVSLEHMKFRDDYGVYVCPHIFRKESPVLEGIRDHDGYWQFFCGQENCALESEPHLIGVGHLTNSDESVNDLTCLEPGIYGERKSIEDCWVFGQLED